MGGGASFSDFSVGRVGGRRLKTHAQWAGGRTGFWFLDRAPVGVARFYEKLPKAKFPVLKELKILPNSLALFVR